jgi:hypothetical protein
MFLSKFINQMEIKSFNLNHSIECERSEVKQEDADNSKLYNEVLVSLFS